MRLSAILGAWLHVLVASGQVLPLERATDWTHAGFQLELPVPSVTVNVLDFGAVGDGVTPNNAALAAALTAVQGAMAVVDFPPGVFRFTAGITLPDSVILRGATADSTTLLFDMGGLGHCIGVYGTEEAGHYPLTQSAVRGSSFLSVTTTEGLVHGDEIRLYRDDADLVTSAWAAGTAGQIARVAILEPDGLNIGSPLRADYPLGRTPYFRKLRMRRFVGIECLRIERLDAAPPDEWSNIHFERASHCWVRGVESATCNFSHIELFASTNCEVGGCYLHHAFAYGGSGQGYGVMAYYTSGENRVFDNVMEHLRHAMIAQSGANGNVFAYNRSIDPYWNEFPLPTNAAGEIVLHGDYAYLNLFEGNVVQNIVIDDSHGANGPFNTLFRNRATGWGLFMNGGTATDSVNLIGNEIGGSPGLFNLTGQGHFLYGNIVQGVVNPAGTDNLMDVSYHAAQLPGYLLPVGGWPQIGPNSVAPGTIPAALRADLADGDPVCPEAELPTPVMEDGRSELQVFPNPTTGPLSIQLPRGVAVRSVIVLDALGARIPDLAVRWTGNGIDLGNLVDGHYLLRVSLMDGAVRIVHAVVVR